MCVSLAHRSKGMKGTMFLLHYAALMGWNKTIVYKPQNS